MSKSALYQKIVKVMEQVGQLVKDGNVVDKNGKKMYSYLSEEQTTAELQAAFIKHGLVLFPIKVEDELIYIETIKYNEQVRAPITRVLVTYKICDAETGEFEELQSIGYGSDSQDKGSNKAMTGAFKYVQRQTFMISTGDDGDHTGSAALDEEYKQPAPQQAHTNAPRHPSQPTQGNNGGGQQTGVKLASEAQVKMLHTKLTAAKMNITHVNQHLNLNIESMNDLPFSKVNELIKYLDANKPSA